MSKDLNCEEVIKTLLEYLDRELDAEAEADIARHIEDCRACFSRAEFERRLRQRIEEAGEREAPESLRQRVRSIVSRF